MAATLSPQRFSPASLPHLPAASPSTQLRDSCRACATSKVKCNKVKPVCDRCAKRGTACEYVASKRAGRRRDSQRTSPSRTSVGSSVDNSCTGNCTPSSNAAGSIDYFGSSFNGHSGCGDSSMSHVLPRSHSIPSSDASHRLSPLVQLSPGQQSPAYPDADFDSFFASLISTNPFDLSDAEVIPLAASHPASVENALLQKPNDVASLHTSDAGFVLVDEATPERSALSKAHAFPDGRAPTSNDDGPCFGPLQKVQAGAPCCCLIRALAILKQLFPSRSTGTRGDGDGNIAYWLPSTQSVVEENERIIEAVNNMLECQCSLDGYLLSLVSIIVFKVLGWYAAAARHTTSLKGAHFSDESQPESRRASGSSCSYEQPLGFQGLEGSLFDEGEDQARLAAQLVLGRLHRVLKVINLLSERLKYHGERSGAADTPDSAGDPWDSICDGGIASPFSAIILNQLETDLRKRFSTLSSRILDTLRES